MSGARSGSFALPIVMRTYYDILSVSEHAAEEVIRAAYKALALRFHPDRNNGSEESRMAMQTLNEAYSVLSSPASRRDYDQFLVSLRAQAAQPPSRPASVGASPKRKARRLVPTLIAIISYDLRLTLFGIGLAVWGLCSLVESLKPKRAYIPSATLPAEQVSSSEAESSLPLLDRLTRGPALPSLPTTPTIQRPSWIRPNLSPEGTPWPSTADYVSGYKIQAQGGLSTVTIDNSANSSEVFLKLVWLAESEAIPARVCYIPAYSKFTFSSVKAGRYDVRYRDLFSGGLSKTEEFDLEERNTPEGTSYSNLTLTLYKVANGNMTTEPIEESEF